MPDTHVVAVPNAGRVILRGGNARISVKHIEDCVGSMREGRNADPSDDLTGDRVILLQFVVQLCNAAWIQAEDDVITVGV